VVTDHIGYPMATISYTGTIQWQPDPEPFGDVISEQQVGPGHDPLIRYPGQWRVDPVLATIVRGAIRGARYHDITMSQALHPEVES
jgi:hypothetical protein